MSKPPVRPGSCAWCGGPPLDPRTNQRHPLERVDLIRKADGEHIALWLCWSCVHRWTRTVWLGHEPVDSARRAERANGRPSIREHRRERRRIANLTVIPIATFRAQMGLADNAPPLVVTTGPSACG